MIEYITVIDKNGNGMLTEGIMYARIKTIDSGVPGVEGKEYIFYTLDETVDETRKKIYIAEAATEPGKANPINDEAWGIIRKLLMKISHKEETPEIEYKKMNGMTFHVSDPKKLAIEMPVKQALKDAYFSGTLANQPQTSTVPNPPMFITNTDTTNDVMQQPQQNQELNAFTATPPMPEMSPSAGPQQPQQNATPPMLETSPFAAPQQPQQNQELNELNVTPQISDLSAVPMQEELVPAQADLENNDGLVNVANPGVQDAIQPMSQGVSEIPSSPNGAFDNPSVKIDATAETPIVANEEPQPMVTSVVDQPKPLITQVPDQTLTGGAVLEDEPELLPPDELHMEQGNVSDNGFEEDVTLEAAEKALKVLLAYINKVKNNGITNATKVPETDSINAILEVSEPVRAESQNPRQTEDLLMEGPTDKKSMDDVVPTSIASVLPDVAVQSIVDEPAIQENATPNVNTNDSGVQPSLTGDVPMSTPSANPQQSGALNEPLPEPTIITDQTVNEFLQQSPTMQQTPEDPVPIMPQTLEESGFIDTSVAGINNVTTIHNQSNDGLTTVNITIPNNAANGNQKDDILQPSSAAPMTQFEPNIPTVESPMPSQGIDEYVHIASTNQGAVQLDTGATIGMTTPVQMPDNSYGVAEATSKMNELVNLGPSGLSNMN